MWRRWIGAAVLLLLVAAAAVAGRETLKSLKPARPVDPAGKEETGDSSYDPEELAVADKTHSVPTKEEVLAARETALDGMTPEQAGWLTEVVTSANRWWEWRYFYDNIFGKLEDPKSLTWNYFDQTGEIQIGWAWSGSLDKDAVCEEEGLTEDEFYAQYGSKVVTTNEYDADAFTALIDELRETVQNEDLKAGLQYIRDEVQLAKRTHVMEHANNLYKALHDLDYFLLRYGPTIDEGKDDWIQDKSTVSKYYGTLPFYS